VPSQTDVTDPHWLKKERIDSFFALLGMFDTATLLLCASSAIAISGLASGRKAIWLALRLI